MVWQAPWCCSTNPATMSYQQDHRPVNWFVNLFVSSDIQFNHCSFKAHFASLSFNPRNSALVLLIAISTRDLSILLAPKNPWTPFVLPQILLGLHGIGNCNWSSMAKRRNMRSDPPLFSFPSLRGSVRHAHSASSPSSFQSSSSSSV